MILKAKLHISFYVKKTINGKENLRFSKVFQTSVGVFSLGGGGSNKVSEDGNTWVVYTVHVTKTKKVQKLICFW